VNVFIPISISTDVSKDNKVAAIFLDSSNPNLIKVQLEVRNNILKKIYPLTSINDVNHNSRDP